MFMIAGAPYHQGAAVTDFVLERGNEMAVYHRPSYSLAVNGQEPVGQMLRKEHRPNRCFTSTAETL